MASNLIPTGKKSDIEIRMEGGTSQIGASATTAAIISPEGTAQNTNQRHVWQIFTDDSGEIQRKSTSVQILENPFNDPPINSKTNPFNTVTTESEQAINKNTLSNGFANLNAYDITSTDSERPPKPKRISAENGRPGSSNSKQQLTMAEDTVVFESDSTYTRFDNVDDHEEEIELNTGDSPVETRRSEKKFLIQCENDLDLVLPPANKPSLWIRLQWCCSGYGRWPKRTVYLKALGVTLAMCLGYALIVLIVVKILD